MNIVLEGPKASGKSTIAKHFINEGYAYFHSTSKTENDFNYHRDLLMNQNNRVIDRFSVGEMIYPTLYDRDGKLDWMTYFLTMNDKNTIYVILYSSSDYILIDRLYNRDGESYLKDASVLVESNMLFKFMSKTIKNENILSFDISQTSTKQIIERIEEKINELQ